MDREWDVAIVGAGMGGGALGFRLARAGHKVVFLEKGAATFAGDEPDEPYSTDPAKRMRQGRWPNELSGMIDGKSTSFSPPLGCGAGGSTLIYGATLERFAPSDFNTVIDEADGQIAWPVTYDEMAPYYSEAEAYLQVSGAAPPDLPPSPSSLRDPIPLSEGDAHFFASLQANGIQAYHLPVAFEDSPDCSQSGGVVCNDNCKKDARNTFVEPALATGSADFFEYCNVERIEATDRAVTALHCEHKGQPLVVRAKIYVLAAGALSTPLLMLKSKSESWPEGIANSSGMVGRNLMFHATDFFAAWPKTRLNSDPPKKSIGIRDFYLHQGVSLGAIQSTGLSADYLNILHFLRIVLEGNTFRAFRFLRPLLRIPAAIAAVLFGRATVFSTILTDLPYRDNRVVPDSGRPGGMRFEYTIRAELSDRVKQMRQLCRQAFRGHRVMIAPTEVSLNLGHGCGTCRFGNDPKFNVLDVNNRTHDLHNLYVADGSFFPTSGGTNPSLTIAANALRVADHISALLRAQQHVSPETQSANVQP
jgi:choline dehydrogenase-like flavoprotein